MNADELRRKELSKAWLQTLKYINVTPPTSSDKVTVMQTTANLFVNKSYAFNWERLGNCAFSAAFGIGFEEIMNISTGFMFEAQKQLVLRFLGKAATRALGWVGAAIFIYELSDCMDWVYNDVQILKQDELWKHQIMWA